MYEEHFKKWNLSKNMNQSKRDKILNRVVRDGDAQSSQPNPGINSDDLLKVLKYLTKKRPTDPSPVGPRGKLAKTSKPCSFCSSSKDEDIEQGVACTEPNSPREVATSKSPTFSHSQYANTPQSYGNASLRSSEQPPTGRDYYNTSHARMSSEWSCESKSPLNCAPFHVNSESLNLETILKTVYSLCVRTHSDQSRQIETPYQVSQNVLGAQANFWSDLKQGIYLLKISSFERAFPVLRGAGELANGAFEENSLAFVQEIFSSLSPSNTATCPGLRMSLLRVFSDFASQKFEQNDPIVILCRELQNDCKSQEVSERALSFMLDNLVSLRGTSYALSFKVQTSLIRLLRRNKDYARAGDLGQKFISSSNCTFGVNSIPARLAARELEHVLMDEQEWHKALEVCYSIVGQRPSSFQLAEPYHRDECAVRTMEDIAKIHENLGDTKSCIAWLIQAANTSWLLFGSCIATTHIIDKLVGALIASGVQDEANFWWDPYNNDASGTSQ